MHYKAASILKKSRIIPSICLVILLLGSLLALSILFSACDDVNVTTNCAVAVNSTCTQK